MADPKDKKLPTLEDFEDKGILCNLSDGQDEDQTEDPGIFGSWLETEATEDDYEGLGPLSHWNNDY